MKKWEELYKNKIPLGNYQVSLKNGEDSGLLIKLDESEITEFKDSHFPNTIYKVQNEEFSKFIMTISNELFDYLTLNHYVVFTMNFIIEILSQWEPDVEVTCKK